ncbi:serine/threonine-protein phosphatase 6 regulatory ankyrin repeat subunit A-like [Trichogramma pretiosum]|uniref:serine/threonine-protein phosphatase 6 regulatory ankyrin repeat subunit A-like n=1 Tax=Trichogramma pretiosum TaxID=7493 RepID=UPI0006C95D08|nr:serine/threonine-protein phosphatase 6 regulatory ankyrin repeat subunit A-like [Trichogramma pretiosum]
MSSSDKLTTFKRLREEANDWNDKNKRREFIRQLVSFIGDWTSELPNLRDFFDQRKINQLLVDAVEIIFTGQCESEGKEIIAFVIRTGYRDEPQFDRINKPILHRLTPLVYVGSCLPTINARETVRELFKIYDFRFNYFGHNRITHFHVACAYGFIDIAEQFLASRQNINCQDRSNNTPLLMATLQGEKEMAKLLLKRGANVCLFNEQRQTPLHLVCQKYEGDHDLVELLFKNDTRQRMRVNAKDNKGNTALHLILEYGREIKETVELLLARGADVGLANEQGQTPLHLICHKYGRDHDWVKSLFEIKRKMRQGMRINAQDNKGNTALHLVVEYGRESEKTVELLLEKGADVGLANEQGQTPLHIICQKYGGDHDLVKSLFKINDYRKQREWVNAKDNKGNTALHLILEYGREIKKTVELLLLRGADVGLANAKGEIPLLTIFSKGEKDLMEVLLKTINRFCRRKRCQTYPVNHQDRRGCTALHYVLERHQNQKWFKWLLSRGANPNLRNNEGMSPVNLIFWNWMCGADDWIFNSFVKHCNDTQQAVEVDAQDKSGRILLNWALRYHERTKVEWLLRAGVDPNVADQEGSTALHVISQELVKDHGFAELLFEICDANHRTVQVDAKDESNRTPIEYALANFYPNIVAALLDHGARLVWPTDSHFDGRRRRWAGCILTFESKFTQIIGALAIMECVENRDYDFDRSQALRIMKYFTELKILDDLKNDQYDVSLLSSTSDENMMIKPSLSIRDLDQMRLKEAWKQLTYQDCYDYLCSINVRTITLRFREICARAIAKKMLRKFLRPWAVISYLELIRYRLPIECCETIIDQLPSRDLLNICFAAVDKNVNSEEQPETK